MEEANISSIEIYWIRKDFYQGKALESLIIFCIKGQRFVLGRSRAHIHNPTGTVIPNLHAVIKQQGAHRFNFLSSCYGNVIHLSEAPNACVRRNPTAIDSNCDHLPVGEDKEEFI